MRTVSTRVQQSRRRMARYAAAMRTQSPSTINTSTVLSHSRIREIQDEEQLIHFPGSSEQEIHPMITTRPSNGVNSTRTSAFRFFRMADPSTTRRGSRSTKSIASTSSAGPMIMKNADLDSVNYVLNSKKVNWFDLIKNLHFKIVEPSFFATAFAPDSQISKLE